MIWDSVANQKITKEQVEAEIRQIDWQIERMFDADARKVYEDLRRKRIRELAEIEREDG